MKKKKEEREKSHIRINNIIALLTVTVLFFISTGFALYNQIINLNGEVSVNTQGDFYISGVRLISSSNVDTESLPSYTNNFISFNLIFKDLGEDSYNAVYEIDVSNDTFYDQTFNGVIYDPIIKDSNGNVIDNQYFNYTISGIDDYTFPRLSTTTLTINIVFTPPVDGDYTVEGELGIDAVEKPEGNLRGTVIGSVGDLTGNNEIVSFKVNVINTYTTNREFRLRLSNSNFIICDQNGNDITFNINTNTEQEYTFYIKKKDGVSFNSSSYDVSISLISTNLPTNNCGSVTLLVDEDSSYTDEDPPVISNLGANVLDTNGSVEVNFAGTDESNIVEYHIIAYKDNNEVSNVTVDSLTTSYTFTNLSEGLYYFVVYGVDSEGNSGESFLGSASTDEGFAMKTSQINCKWVFNVTYNLTNLNATNGTVNRGQTYTGTISGTRAGLITYNVPNNLDSVTMGGVRLSNREYTYTHNNNDTATITIPNVTGDIVISATGTNGGCLVEGTKILLANGKYKNIEDIDYDDLLTVYDHVNGNITYVYPIWLEKKQVSNNYIKVTLEDNTSIKFTKDHSLYNADTNMYASILDSNQIDVGSNVYKIKNNKLIKVKIKKIEKINKKVNYYNIVSTIHYNVFSNDILTSDSTAAISNIYGFNDDATYSDNYKKISNGKELSYDKVSFIPKYLYYGLNLRNASFIEDYDISLYDLLNTYTNDNNIMKSINSKNNKLVFLVNIDNKVDKVFEGTKYKLPNNKNIKYYIDTSTNKKYKPGTNIEIDYSVYLKSIKK